MPTRARLPTGTRPGPSSAADGRWPFTSALWRLRSSPCSSRRGRCTRLAVSAGSAWAGGDLAVGLHDLVAVLVRVDAELAERIHRGRGDHRAVDRPASARV